VTSGPEIDYLSVDDLLEIAAGVIKGVQIRDVGLLASAAGRPRATAFGVDAYPGFTAKAAALLHSLARNHALADGNKRLAWSATRAFCLLNGRDLHCSVEAAEAMIVGVAAGELDVPDLVELLRGYVGPGGYSLRL
jgi:death-on-curing protein